MRILTSRSWLNWLMIAFGAIWAISNAQDIEGVAETRGWPTTPGTIVTSDIVAQDVGTYIGKYSSHTMYANRLHLTYAYDVDGSRYTGSQWNVLPPSSNLATHVMLRRYPPGRGVAVHYDPRDPTQAVLDTALPIGRYVQLACALLVLLAAIGWPAVASRRTPTSGARDRRSSSAASRGA